MTKLSRLLIIVFCVLAAGLQPVQAQTNGAFVLTSVALYQPDEVLRERLGDDTAALSTYLLALRGASERVFSSVPRARGVTGSIVVAVKPGGLSRFWLVQGKNGLPKGLRKSLLEELASVKPPTVRHGPIAIAINFDAWGGGQPVLSPGERLPIPDEWRAAMQGQPAGVLPDAPLHLAWP